MPKTAVQLLVLTLTTSLCLILPVQAETTSKTIVVPIEYPTIAVAIGNAKAGDTIMVKSGTYDETALEIDKSLTISSEFPYQAKILFHPPTYEQTIQLGRLESSRITTMHFRESIHILADKVKISGFVITNAPMDFPANSTQMGKDETGIVSANGNQIQITDNIFGTEEKYFHLSITGSGNQALHNAATAVSVAGSNQTVSNNNVRGLDVSGSFNTITKNSAGSLILTGDYNNVADNSFTHDRGGGHIRLTDADHNTFTNNTVICDWLTGISIGYALPQGGSYNVFAGNIVQGASLWGVLIAQGDYNVFDGNLIANNGGLGHDGYGLALGGVDIGGNNNLFYGNIFMNNSKNFGSNWEVLGSNAFDDGNAGNYWDDYFTKYPNATEVDHTGIGNTPYLVYGTGKDNYPLINLPKLPEKITPIPWSTSFSTIPMPSQETPSTEDNRTTTPSDSSSNTEDNKNSSTPSDTNSVLNLPVELIFAFVAVAIVAVVAVTAVVYWKKRKR